MKFNFIIIYLFLTFLISVQGENNETITVHGNTVVEPLSKSTKIVNSKTQSTKTITLLTKNTKSISINSIDKLPYEKVASFRGTRSTPPLHYTENLKNVCIMTTKYLGEDGKDSCNELCVTAYLKRKFIRDSDINNTKLVYCALHETYNYNLGECSSNEKLLILYYHICSIYGTTYNPDLSACMSSSPYNETEGCYNSNSCGQAWIEENDDYKYKICHKRHLAYSNLDYEIPIKLLSEYISNRNSNYDCINECLVDSFSDSYGMSREKINDVVRDCKCAINEPARLCRDECSISYNMKYFLDYSKDVDYTVEYSIQRNGDGLEWCKCPSPIELKYISKAEKPECCSGDECLNTSLPKCCSESKAFIPLDHIFYGVENGEYCIWPAEKKIPEIVQKTTKSVPPKPTSIPPTTARSGSKNLGNINNYPKIIPVTTTSNKVISSIPTLSNENDSMTTISNAKTLSIITNTEVNILPITLTSTEDLTMLMTVPKKKVIKITKKVTEKVTKKVTVKVTKKKDLPQ